MKIGAASRRAGGGAQRVRALVGLSIALVLSGAMAVLAQEDCMDCHDVDVEQIGESVHGFLECLDCHPSAEEVPHPDAIYGFECVNCHDDAAEEYARSIHGQMQSSGDDLVTGCTGCHEKGHEILGADNPEALIHPLNQPELCGSCHSKPELASRSNIHLVFPLESYTESIHSRALQRGEDGATCDQVVT